MPRTIPATGRRREALSASLIVRTAIEILDSDGVDRLTFRTLAERLSTGPGAIYHHVANKEELLAAAAAELITAALARETPSDTPDESVRTLMLDIFDVIDAHPWIGVQLSRVPWQSAMVEVFEIAGERLASLGVPEEKLFDAASALVNYVLGVAGQYAAGLRVAGDRGRTAFLETVTTDWTSRGSSTDYPFVHAMADRLAHHDERQQFIAGIGFFLSGIAACRQVTEDTPSTYK